LRHAACARKSLLVYLMTVDAWRDSCANGHLSECVYTAQWMRGSSKRPAAIRRTSNRQPKLALTDWPRKDDRISWPEWLRLSDFLSVKKWHRRGSDLPPADQQAVGYASNELVWYQLHHDCIVTSEQAVHQNSSNGATIYIIKCAEQQSRNVESVHARCEHNSYDETLLTRLYRTMKIPTRSVCVVTRDVIERRRYLVRWRCWGRAGVRMDGS